jgi:hypothetical protein
MRDLTSLETSSEEPVVLLIMNEGGIPIFSHVFSEDWSFENDLISGFLSAINSFSGELFSEGLDRAKFGEHTIVMKPMQSFSVSYLFKGQSYKALKRIYNFIYQIQNTNEIWNEIDFSNRMSKITNMDRIPQLKTVIESIFI